MTSFEQQLLAAGFPPEVAARDAWANEVVRLQNREHEAYGRHEQNEHEER